MITNNNLLWLSRLAFVTFFIGCGIIATLTLPFSSGTDEVAHFKFGHFIAQHGRLPTTNAERTTAGYKSDLPPLYHLQFGILGSWIDLASPPYIKFITNNPRLQLVSGIKTINVWGTLHITDPLQGEYLLWHLGRWLTLFNSVICLILIHRIMTTMWPQQPWLTLTGTALLAFLPTYFKNSLVITYEPMLGMWMAAYFLVLYYTLRQPKNLIYYFILGLLLGLASLTKYTPIPIILWLIMLTLWLARRDQWTVKMLGSRLLLILGGIILTFGSWLLFTIFYFNQIENHGLIIGLIRTFLAGDGSDTTSLRLVHLLSGGTQGMQNSLHQDSFVDWLTYFLSDIVGNDWLPLVMLPLVIMAIWGLILQWQTDDSFNRTWMTVLIGHLACLLILPFVRFIMTHEASTGAGRHLLFPGAVPLLLLFIYGLQKWLSYVYLTFLLLALLPLAVIQSYGDYAHELMTPLPVQTVPLANEIPLREYEEVVLVDFDIVADSQRLTAKLWWRVERLINQDYQLQLTLVDETGNPQVRWRGQPLDGAYPTRAWFPEDRIRTDIVVPIAGLPAGTYSLQLQLLSDQAKPIPPLNQADDRLTELALQPGPFIPTDQLTVDDNTIGYTILLQREPLSEWGTVLVMTEPILPPETEIQLLGPENRTYQPLDRLGRQLIFQFRPPFVAGKYALQISDATSSPFLMFKPQKRQFEIGPLTNPVEANFADYLTLLGYEVPQRTVSPGGAIPITLHWQARRTIGADLIFFIHLIGPDGQRWGNQERLTRDLYSTILWVPQEIVSDSFSLQVAPDAPTGEYQLLVGVYLPVGEAVSLPLMKDGDYSEVTHVNLGAIRVE